MINQSNIFKKIGYILNELQDQYQFLSENPEQLSELELELFLANANFLSDHVEIVKKLNNNRTIKELPQHVEVSKDDIVQPIIQQEQPIQQVQPVEQEQPVQEVQNNDNLLIGEIEREELQQEDLPPAFEFVINEHPATDKFDFEEKSVNEMFDRTLSREEERIIAEKQKLTDSSFSSVPDLEHADEAGAEPFLVSEEIQTPPTEPAPKVYDIPVAHINQIEETPQVPNPVTSAHRPTLNDLLAGKNSSGNLAEEITRPSVTDLKRTITLNEKLLYIKDLFNGYNLAYSEAIDLINKMPDFKTADTFLKNNYAVKNNWEAKQSTVAQFYELLKQRFPED